jgi:hypothetical protein
MQWRRKQVIDCFRLKLVETAGASSCTIRSQNTARRPERAQRDKRQAKQGRAPMRHWSGAEFPCRHLAFAAHVTRNFGQYVM